MIPDPHTTPEAYRVLLDHSVRLLEPGDLIERAGRMVQVHQVTTRNGSKVISFAGAAPDMLVSSPRWDGVDVTVYRPRAGF